MSTLKRIALALSLAAGALTVATPVALACDSPNCECQGHGKDKACDKKDCGNKDCPHKNDKAKAETKAEKK